LTGNPTKARIFKGLRGKPKGYQQSYPQKFWISYKYPVKSSTCGPYRRNAWTWHHTANTKRGLSVLLTAFTCPTYAHKPWCSATWNRWIGLAQKSRVNFFRWLIHNDFFGMPHFRAICSQPVFMRLGRLSGQDVNKVIHRNPGLLTHPRQIKHLATKAPDHIHNLH